jgi:hypothetical protein
MSVAQLIATHMNAPYGRVVSAADVVASLHAGHLCAASKAANEILSALFVEVEPRLILRCAAQEQVAASKVQKLYEDTVRVGLMPVPEWEKTMGALA